MGPEPTLLWPLPGEALSSAALVAVPAGGGLSAGSRRPAAQQARHQPRSTTASPQRWPTRRACASFSEAERPAATASLSSRCVQARFSAGAYLRPAHMKRAEELVADKPCTAASQTPSDSAMLSAIGDYQPPQLPRMGLRQSGTATTSGPQHMITTCTCCMISASRQRTIPSRLHS